MLKKLLNFDNKQTLEIVRYFLPHTIQPTTEFLILNGH